MVDNSSIEEHQPEENKDLKKESKDEMLDFKKYKLRFDKETAEKIQLFCQVLYLDVSFFVVRTIIPELEAIAFDTEEDFDIFASFFDLQKFAEDRCEGQTPKVIEKKYEFEVEIHPIIAKPIEEYSKAIHWTPENFIVSIIEYKIKDLFNDLRRHCYQFMGNYFVGLNEISKSVDNIYENKLG